ncbi:MAG: acyl-CoA reductase [Bacteroidetes bacterium]|nr:acyl-CoA reductase [Bacteroidota bacterium]
MPTSDPTAIIPPAMGARIDACGQLGAVLGLFGAGAAWPGHASGLTEAEFQAFDRTVRAAQQLNGWYTEANVRHALAALARMLERPALVRWLAAYPALERPRAPRTVGIIMAGNIPFVGFHDLLCVLLAGHRARVKCASDDAGLTPAVVALLERFAPDLAAQVAFATGKLGGVDAVVATGSTNTSRYFEHYFGHLPRIVRKGRTSVAVLDGTETEAELTAFGEDVFRYFGLGCRNVGKVFLPQDFDLDRLFRAFYPWKDIIEHHKYANNYDYNKAIWLLDRAPLLENGFLLMKEEQALASPVAALYYERYSDRPAVERRLGEEAAHLQCIIGHGHVPFGEGQCPGPGEYADGVDTMAFLLALHHSVNS